MKRLLLYFTIVAFAFAACEPMEDRDSFTNVKVNESDLEVSATAVEVDGKNSNEVVVENNSPLLSRWISDRNQIESAYGTVFFDEIGDREVQFKGLNGDGSQVETSLPVTIDTITSLPEDVISRMGIEFNDDNTVNTESEPYFWGSGDYEMDVDYDFSVNQEVDENDGSLGNKISVETDAPYLSNWTFGSAGLNKNKGELFVTSTGTYTLSLDYTKSDGTVIEDAYTEDFDVEKLTYVPQALLDLFGDFISNPDTSKTWQWARSGKVWANGPLRGFSDPGAGWWQNDYSNMEGRQDGTMTFKFLDEPTLTKEVTAAADEDNVEPVGTYSGSAEVDLGASVEGYSVGTLKLDGITILYGVDVNAGNAPFQELSIVKVNENTLILGGDSDDTGQTWLYKFEYVKE